MKKLFLDDVRTIEMIYDKSMEFEFDIFFFDNSTNTFTTSTDTETFFETAIGIGISWKWVSDYGFLIDINGGIGRNLGLSDGANLGDITGRFGVNFGWQF